MERRDREAAEAEDAVRRLEEFATRAQPGPPAVTATLDLAAVEVLEVFARTRVEALLLKGPVLARVLYLPGERRDYSDIDVLVSPRDLTKAGDALKRLGYRNASEGLGIDDVGGVVHEELWVGGGRETLIEVHFWLAGALLSPQAAWGVLATRRTWLDLNGHRAPVLDRPGLAMHLATHVAQHGSDYGRGLRDLQLGLERWPFDVWCDAAALAAEIQATSAFAAGLRLIPAGLELAGALGLPATDELSRAISLRASRPRGTFHLQAFSEADSLRARVSVLRRSLLPSRRWITRQYPWADNGGGRLILAYLVHVIRAPGMAARAWRFRRRLRATHR